MRHCHSRLLPSWPTCIDTTGSGRSTMLTGLSVYMHVPLTSSLKAWILQHAHECCKLEVGLTIAAAAADR